MSKRLNREYLNIYDLNVSWSIFHLILFINRCVIVDIFPIYNFLFKALIARVLGEGAPTDNKRVYKISEKINLKPLVSTE